MAEAVRQGSPQADRTRNVPVSALRFGGIEVEFGDIRSAWMISLPKLGTLLACQFHDVLLYYNATSTAP